MTDHALDARGHMSRLEKRIVNSQGHSLRVGKALERMLSRIPLAGGERLLDVGCGNGAATAYAGALLGLDVTGVDADPAQIEAATAFTSASSRFRVADARGLPFENATFDVVLSNKATHHIREWPTALAEMLRVLRPGGHLVWSDLALPAGRRYPSARAVDSILAREGLDVVWKSRSPFHYAVAAQKPV